MKLAVAARKRKLTRSDYAHADAVEHAKFFLGKYLMARSAQGVTGGIICETEAYQGPEDKAAHSYGNRRTKRTEIMFGPGGRAYVYFCYGMHNMFNIVTGPKDHPHAILIRAVWITNGIELAGKRRKGIAQKDWASGPGRVAAAMGITTKQTGVDLTGDEIWIEDRGVVVPEREIVAGPRVGVDYAGEWAKRPWRFLFNPIRVAD